MNGRTDGRFVLDSCACINFLNKKNPLLPLGDLYISVITRMEVLAKPDFAEESEKEAKEFLKKVTVVPLLGTIESAAVSIRRKGSPRLKLPDAIVAATAVVLDAQLISTDNRLRRLVWPGFNVAM